MKYQDVVQECYWDEYISEHKKMYPRIQEVTAVYSILEAIANRDFTGYKTTDAYTLFEVIFNQLFCKLIIDFHILLNDGQHNIFSFKNKIINQYCIPSIQPTLRKQIKQVIDDNLKRIVKELRHVHLAHYTDSSHARRFHSEGLHLNQAATLVKQVNQLFKTLSFEVAGAYRATEYYIPDIEYNMTDLYGDALKRFLNEYEELKGISKSAST